MGEGLESDWLYATAVVSTAGHVFCFQKSGETTDVHWAVRLKLCISKTCDLKVYIMCCTHYAFSKFCLPLEHHTSINLEAHFGDPLTIINLG